MQHRLVSTVLLITMLACLAGSAQASPSKTTALLQVFVPGASAMQHFASTGLPAYTFLDGFLLAGAPAPRQPLLEAAGLEYRVLDADMHGGEYYLAFARPGRGTPTWGSYGRVLLRGSDYALLRTTPEAANQLTATGIDLRRVSLTPKPIPDLAAEADIFPEVITPDLFVQQLIDQVTQSEIYALTGGLSGATPVTIGGEPYTITTRHTYSGEPVQQATQYVYEYLEDLELVVETHEWESGAPPNVIGEIPGLVNPQDIYIIGAHLDDAPSGLVAPGADDNASGSVATMLAAQIFSQYYWGCTLRFALWTGEEQGMLGSAVYAWQARQAGENILGYLNLDMIAWDTDDQPGIDLHATRTIPATLDLANLFADVITAYDLALVPEIFPDGLSASDHSSFWDYNYVSILGIEDDDDFNDYYHTTSDQLQYLNMAYYTEFVKASLATFAHMSSCRLPTGLLEGTVTANSNAEPIPGAALVFTDSLGHTFSTLTDSSGYYRIVLPTGTYSITVSADGYQPAVLAEVTLVADTQVIQDFTLRMAAEPWIIYLPLSLRGDD